MLVCFPPLMIPPGLFAPGGHVDLIQSQLNAMTAAIADVNRRSREEIARVFRAAHERAGLGASLRTLADGLRCATGSAAEPLPPVALAN